jgi:class 3 adenylate cyclase
MIKEKDTDTNKEKPNKKDQEIENTNNEKKTEDIKSLNSFSGPLNIPNIDSSQFTVDLSSISLSSGALSSTGSYYIPSYIDPSILRAATVNPNYIFTISPEQERLENAIADLRNENRRLAKDIAIATEAKKQKVEEIEKLKENVEELSKKQRLKHLLDRVNESAQKKLLESNEFRKKFEETQPLNTVVMSVDIRRSTELMLKARTPQLYADFITSLCVELTNIILRNYGIFDKFTGDGILAFFPDFYSGQDAPYFVIKAANECHDFFSKHYQSKRDCFNTVLMDIGLGIGIDYGQAHLVNIQDGLTVIGTPVVYACRLSGAKAGQTLLNQPAYEVISQNYSKYVDFQEAELDIKHEGKILAYQANVNKKSYNPKLPQWIDIK